MVHPWNIRLLFCRIELLNRLERFIVFSNQPFEDLIYQTHRKKEILQPPDSGRFADSRDMVASSVVVGS